MIALVKQAITQTNADWGPQCNVASLVPSKFAETQITDVMGITVISFTTL